MSQPIHSDVFRKEPFPMLVPHDMYRKSKKPYTSLLDCQTWTEALMEMICRGIRVAPLPKKGKLMVEEVPHDACA
jgi:hypothetical protein